MDIKKPRPTMILIHYITHFDTGWNYFSEVRTSVFKCPKQSGNFSTHFESSYNFLSSDHFDSLLAGTSGEVIDTTLWNELKFDDRKRLSRREWYQKAANLYRYNF